MAVLEQWVLDGLALNDATLFLESISDPPAQKKPEWISGADNDGAVLGRRPTHENKVIEMRLRVAQTATMTLAVAKIAAVLDKLQECEHNANGLGLVWTPAGVDTAAGTYRCLLGEITDLPKDWQDSGWFVRSPAFTVRLTTLPFFEGTEVLAGSVTSSDPMQVVTLTDVAGDVPARGRLVVTDAATQWRRYVAWGMESRWLATTGAPSLIVDSASMTTTGYAGVTATRTGAYSGGTNNVISATLLTQLQAVCGIGNLSHVGSFRPHLRFYASATTMAVRLTFQTLDGPFRSLSYRVPVAVGWNVVDLGLVSIPATPLGTQRWTGRIEAKSTAVSGETFEVDVMLMVPAESFGRARGTYAYAPPLLAGYDDFAAHTAGAVIGGTTARIGGTWTTSGATTGDFTAYQLAGSTTVARRNTVSDGASPRVATLGAARFDTEAGVQVQWDSTASITTLGVRARNSGANYAFVELKPQTSTLRVGHTALAAANRSVTVPVIANTWYGLRLVVYESGMLIGTLLDANGATIKELRYSDTVLAFGGLLDDGTAGFHDLNAGATAVNRYYDNFYVGAPTPEPVVINEGQSIEFRHDAVLREDASGVYAGPPPEYVGSRFTVPNAGGPDRQTRVGVMARRNDVGTFADDNIADATTVQVYVTPRFLAVPRA